MKARGWPRRFLRHGLSATTGGSQPGRKQTALRAAPAILILLLPVFGRQEVGRQTKEPLIGFSEHLIMSGYGYAYGLAVGDLDEDGDLDLTSADAEGRCMYWFENDGKGNFRRHFVQRPSAERRWLERHAIGDVNLDRHLDVVSVDNVNGRLLWFENNGAPAAAQEWKQHVITDAMAKAYDVALVDIDNDGDLDVVCSSWLGNAIAWFENPYARKEDRSRPIPRQSDRRSPGSGAREEGPWLKHMIDADLTESRTIRVADFDQDGYPDLLATGTGRNLVVWYQHPGADVSRPWRRHVIADTMFRPIHGHPVDMDGDGDIDVVMAGGSGDESRGSVVWYENDGKPAGGTWKSHVICEHLPTASEAFAADLDADGTVEVVVTRWGRQGGLYLFKHTGDPRGLWRQQALKEGWVKASQVLIADLDGDKLPDIVAEAERGSNDCRWWRNLGRKRE